ncbi:MAG: DUF475 domain-containing protein [Candidatus Liberibacter ctenarytainae]|uniref:DUF475 domain-containing protein n=1 Tax=Candidatus Liberibacter ctenarytainae TaxID=2020335 RepID=A0A937ACU2_9HYPH|nr:DUF475 domain-containing protein [Candidatus Liberibacter ctenarytainae]
MKKNMLHSFRWAILVTIVGILLSILIGWNTTHTISGTSEVLYICIILSIIEISLSCDNAILNAQQLQKMSPLWQKRFLTWGILISVFVMRIIFPIMIFCISATINPIEAVKIALFSPQDYSKVMTEAHLPIAGFGGTFLMMISLSFFFDTRKNIHWISFLEKPMSYLAKIKGLKFFLTLSVAMGIAFALPRKDVYILFYSSLFAITVFYAICLLEYILSSDNGATILKKKKYGLSLFLYLEIIDASLSFDGVISAFALTKNFLIIIIGLAIGAVYVRSMTLVMMEKGILNRYKYLEHGAFYSILVLSIMMFLQTIRHIPEIITGTCSIIFILLSIYSSIVRDRKNSSTKKRI